MKKIITAFLLSSISAFAVATPFPQGDAQAGEKLFKQYQCDSCHKNMYGGDGSGIFTRADHKVRNPAQLLAQISRCGGNVGKEFSKQEQSHLAAYLNRYYHFD